MPLKLSDLNDDEIETIGGPGSQIGHAPKPASLKLSDLEPHELETVEPLSNPSISPVTALTTGMIEGAVPFAAPIAGAGRATMNALTGVTGPLAGGKLSDIVEDYRRGRDLFSGDVTSSAAANPAAAFAGNIAGGVANPLFRGANTLGKASGAAALQGLGQGEADLTKGEIGKALAEAQISGLGGAAGYGIGKAIPKLWEGTKYFGKKALTTLGPSEEAINARLAGKAQDTAKNYPQIAEDMAGTLKNLQNQILEKSNAAKSTLATDPTIPRAYVDSALDDATKSLGLKGKLIGATDKEASNVLNSLKEDISELGPNVSEYDLKTLIQKMDDNINWDDQSRNKLNNILKGIRQKFDDTLKFQNPSYKEAMVPVAERVGLLEDTRKLFNFKHVPGEGLQPTDTTASKIQTSLRENKAMTRDTLERLQNVTESDYLSAAKDFQLANQFSKTAPNGSRRTVLGGAIGGLLGAGSPGTIGLGAVAGATLDRYGGQALGKVIDTYLKAGNSKAFGKFEPVLKKAADQGPQALAFLGAMLGKNPEFRQIVDSLKIPEEQ